MLADVIHKHSVCLKYLLICRFKKNDNNVLQPVPRSRENTSVCMCVTLLAPQPRGQTVHNCELEPPAGLNSQFTAAETDGGGLMLLLTPGCQKSFLPAAAAAAT